MALDIIREACTMCPMDAKSTMSIEEGNRHGFVSNESGIVICGDCLHGSYTNAVAGGYSSIARAIREAIEPFDPSEGDDWCSNCDGDIVPRTDLSMPRITIEEANAEVRAMIQERER